MRMLELARDRYLLRLDVGEELVGGVTDAARRLAIRCASVSGIGGLEDVELGYLDRAVRDYLRYRLEGFWELVSLKGNLTLFEDQPLAHLHAILSGPRGETRGGHLFAAIVGATAEIFLHVADLPLRRRPVPRLGIKQIDVEESDPA